MAVPLAEPTARGRKTTERLSALRGGTVAGDHAVMFLSDSERLTLSHMAENRTIFAKGALRAAEWLQSKTAGRYTMPEVLGL